MMWHDYSIRYIKHNRTGSLFLAAIAFIAATLLSLVSTVFYNIWADRIEQQLLTKGEVSAGFEPIVLAYVFVLLVICVSLIAMIHNAFELSMNGRLHQLGILQSVGATPKQIRAFLLYEGFVLCTLPILGGIVVGIGLSYAFMELIIQVTAVVRTHQVLFRYHIGMSLIALLASLLTVGFSVWIPARKVSKLAPLLAIHSGSEQPVAKMKRFRLISALFGVEGELARKSLYARRRAMRTATLSLALSFLGLISFLNLETISRISTQYTYFERYRDSWDLLLTFEGGLADEASLLTQIRQMTEVTSATGYKTAVAYTALPQQALSPELVALGGLTAVAPTVSSLPNNQYLVRVPILVLDAHSFADYAAAVRPSTAVDPTQPILVNTIWDNLHSDRLHRRYVPYLDSQTAVDLSLFSDPAQPANQPTLAVSIATFAQQGPKLKEEFPQYSLLLIVSDTFYSQLETLFPYQQSHINVLTATDDGANRVQEQLTAVLPPTPSYNIANRIQEEAADASMRNALQFVMGSLAALLAGIGLANVFSNALGQIQQRKREFARYLSVGLSPNGLGKILGFEVLLIALRPMLLSLLINVPVVLLALNASSVPGADFVKQMPVWPTAVFFLFILLAVSLAYYLGGKTVYNSHIIETLKDESLI